MDLVGEPIGLGVVGGVPVNLTSVVTGDGFELVIEAETLDVPAHLLADIFIDAQDDEGSAYRQVAGETGGTGTEAVSTRHMQPVPPPTATELQLSFLTPGGDRTRVVLPLPGELPGRHRQGVPPVISRDFPDPPRWRLRNLWPSENPGLTAELLALQQSSYAVEARIIGDDRIPPLHESEAELIAAQVHWLGLFDEGELGAAIAWTVERDPDGTPRGLDIDRLVVRPDRHRRGLATELLGRVVDAFGHQPITVSTGRDSVPARNLYARWGFGSAADEEVLPGLWITHLTRAPSTGR